MLRFLLLASLVACSLGAATLRRPRLDGRIQGGRPVDIADFPYVVAFENMGRYWCGGSIISPDWVLTTSGCLNRLMLSNLRVRAGSSIRESGGTLHPVAQLIGHGMYFQVTHDFDVAVARVSIPFQYRIGVQPISMASTEPAAGSIAVVSGWGALSDGSLPSQLQAVNLFIASRSECNNVWGVFFTENMICSSLLPGTGLCTFDRGGPLVVGGQLVGIVSWSICSTANPVVGTNIAHLKSWVTESTGVQ